jgi:GNAT superfamily N-acetyltransferase
VNRYEVRGLDSGTWADFAAIVEANNGVWGGCWCMWYHRRPGDEDAAARRQAKECLVREGRAHAALVYQGEACVGWCQFGSPAELPRIHNQRAYLATDPALPDWRITCFFAGKGHRGKGVATAALRGAIEQIKSLGGGRIEAYPDDTDGHKAAPAFLFNGALSTFEHQGFKRERLIGKRKWVVTRTVRASKPSPSDSKRS